MKPPEAYTIIYRKNVMQVSLYSLITKEWCPLLHTRSYTQATGVTSAAAYPVIYTSHRSEVPCCIPSHIHKSQDWSPLLHTQTYTHFRGVKTPAAYPVHTQVTGVKSPAAYPVWPLLMIKHLYDYWLMIYFRHKWRRRAPHTRMRINSSLSWLS